MASYRAGTIVARNYLAQARVLARSFQEHNPDIAFETLIIDGTEVDRGQDGVGTVVLPGDLGLEPSQLHSMMLIYDVMEFATALKPSFLGTLLNGVDAAAYFDPDIRVYASLVDVFEAARANGIALTPHNLRPVPRDGKSQSERTIMNAGIYNLGFIAVAQEARPFLKWWHERLAVDAVVDFFNALFTDQRWVDWAPALFPTVMLRDLGLNAAYWNLHERPLTRVNGHYFAGVDALRFFHFSGFDADRPWLLSSHVGHANDSPRVMLSELPLLRELCASYGDELAEFGHSELRRIPYGLNRLPNGLPITTSLRRMARSILKGEFAKSVTHPDPFSETDEFTNWLSTPAWGNARLTPAQWSVWADRPDLSDAFPDPLEDGGDPFVKWCREDPEAPQWLAEVDELAGGATRAVTGPQRRTTRPSGWSVLTYANAELGIGETGRRLADIVAQAGVPMELVGTRLGTSSRLDHQNLRRVETRVGYDNVVSAINADSIIPIGDRFGLDRRRGIHIGLWFWELEQFPDSFAKSAAIVDEVWAATAFTQLAIQAAIDKPVRLMRFAIEVPTRPTRYTRRSLGMPENKFVFITNFDYFSIHERKNPMGTIRAYLDAFGPDDGATLIVKSINGHRRVPDREQVRAIAGGRADVQFFDDYVTRDEVRAMIELSDCLISLHRAEGYGLNIADAYGLGTPTIATGYSGNLEFMTPDTSLLVPFGFVDVPPGSDPYPAGAFWADPDLDAAAQAMRLLFDDREFGHTMAVRAREHALKEHSWTVAVDSVRALLEERAQLA